MVLPMVYLVVRALGAGAEVWELLFRGRTLAILARSVVLAAVVTGASTVIAVVLAWLTVRTDLPLRRWWAVLTILPLVIPSYVGAFLIIVGLGPRGMLQQFLEGPLGIERLPEIYGFPGAMLILTLLSYPYVLLTVRAALWRLDPALEEASLSLGHGAWDTFRRVTLPLLRPAIAAGALLVALYTLSDFGAVSLLRYETFTWAIYLQYEAALDRTAASALSLVLVALALSIVFLEATSRGRARYHRSTVGAVRRPATVRLGKWRWPALAFCGGIALFALAIPMAILVYWVVRGIAAGEALGQVWGVALNSAYVSGLAALACVAAALPVAYLSVRHPGRISNLLERISYMGFALPGIVIALALVFFGANFVTPIYQTVALLIFAYMVLFLPTALGAARASLLQVSPRVEEAARSLGRTPLQTMAAITLPLVRQGVLSGAALVFLVTMKELPATLLLSPIGFKTLATTTWAASSEAFFAKAAAPALLIIAVSSLAVAIMSWQERRGGSGSG
ncbi:MAG: iron ABC transporter permease [Dehalococcoidia bacterium]|nr:iron ABC transporter permease [Dehalococcoidia bacterium]